MPPLEIDLARSSIVKDGITTRSLLRDSGHSDHRIDGAITRGVLIPLFPGIYRVTGHPATWRGALRAAYYWGGDGALVTGASLLALKELDGFPEAQPDLYVRSGKRHDGVRTRRLPSDRSMTRRPHDGMWTTTIDRSLLDACVTHPSAQVGLAMDDALRKGTTSIRRLNEEVRICEGKGNRGVRVFRTLVSMRDRDDESVRSVLETKMLQLLRRISTHRFIPNLEVVGRQRYFLDFGVPEIKLGIECHSRRWHGTGRLAPDMERHRDLTFMGWTILYFTWEEVILRPEEVIRDIELALAVSLPF